MKASSGMYVGPFVVGDTDGLSIGLPDATSVGLPVGLFVVGGSKGIWVGLSDES